jgi:hypothetical protein
MKSRGDNGLQIGVLVRQLTSLATTRLDQQSGKYVNTFIVRETRLKSFRGRTRKTSEFPPSSTFQAQEPTSFSG